MFDICIEAELLRLVYLFAKSCPTWVICSQHNTEAKHEYSQKQNVQ